MSAIAILLLAINTNLLSHANVNLIATSSVTITTDKDEGDGDGGHGGDGESNPIESEEQQSIQPSPGVQQKSIQPSPSPSKQQQLISDNFNGEEYDVVIPDGAAWRETISERFEPSELSVPIGSVVTWTNEDDLTHAIATGTKNNYGLYEYTQDGTFNSGELNKGESFTFQFTKPGRHEYFCIPHPWMTGVVVVE